MKSAQQPDPRAARLRPSRFRVTPARLALCLVVWVPVTVAAGIMVSITHVGPVILTVSRGHGLHLGDVPVIGAALALALAVGAAVLVDWRARPPRVPPG